MQVPTHEVGDTYCSRGTFATAAAALTSRDAVQCAVSPIVATFRVAGGLVVAEVEGAGITDHAADRQQRKDRRAEQPSAQVSEKAAARSSLSHGGCGLRFLEFSAN
jgi:hypothetical protein